MLRPHSSRRLYTFKPELWPQLPTKCMLRVVLLNHGSEPAIKDCSLLKRLKDATARKFVNISKGCTLPWPPTQVGNPSWDCFGGPKVRKTQKESNSSNTHTKN